jgi:allantoinase
MSHDLVVRARRVVTTAGEVARCIGVTGGTVAAIEPLESELEGDRVVELGDDVVLLPGLVDTHVTSTNPDGASGRDLPPPPGRRPAA